MSQHRLDNPIVRNDSLYLSFLSMNPIQPKKEFKIKTLLRLNFQPTDHQLVIITITLRSQL